MYVSGQVPFQSGTVPEIFKGKVTSVVSIEIAQDAARQCTLNALSHIKAALGSLDRVSKFVRLSGFVNSDTTFINQPKVINAASDMLALIFGDIGKHSRSAIGVCSCRLGVQLRLNF